ncbi:MFS transporter [Brachyspira hyodysenteriae]|uniref:Sugar transporter n=1 Tax=Brachyspira hyodysenteriae ATCC 27164 TaxID=1266923 RepID=A0A3B6VS84_BRAHO|nr:MFS transporter [Brachyspira hyodysenteriae]ANN63493.1 sugar transporter [Brachyspira hyodysenteriae ATCC 27164]MCZ9837826.1 MFS transporter [Brachyspira hyodysenteriae]MCZ9848944.1 MFS transporter [Brachyspira hyodysenteriae]MCZ9874178.1 MFS transporter [Brachyspira hyodysenteriae]MCZ9876137.1 MFS transporter [Brachyspira hyodysenteriae]
MSNNNDENVISSSTSENRLLAIISLVLLSFALGTSEFIVIGVLTEIAEGFNITEVKAGGLVSMFALAYSVCTPFSAAIAGKFNRFHFIIFAGILFIVGNFLCSLASNYTFLLIVRMFIAIISGALISVSISFSPYISTKDKRPMVVAWIYSGFSIASIFGVPIGTSISYYFGWRASFIFISIFSAVMLILMFITLPKNTPTHKVKLLGQFILFKDARFILSTFTILFGAASSYVLYTYLKPIFLNYIHIPNKYVSAALLVFGVTVLFSNLLSGKLAEHNGVYRLRYVFMMQFLCMIVLPFALLNAVSSSIVILIIGFLMYLMNSPVQLNILDFTEREYPSCLTLASSNNSFSFNFGIALGSFVGSSIFDNFGIRWVGFGGAVLSVLAFLSIVCLYKINNKNDNI